MSTWQLLIVGAAFTMACGPRAPCPPTPPEDTGDSDTDTDADADTGSVVDTGTDTDTVDPNIPDGTYIGTFTMEKPQEWSGVHTCTGDFTVVVDAGANPQISGSGLCLTTTLSTVNSVTIRGSLDGAPNVLGTGTTLFGSDYASEAWWTGTIQGGEFVASFNAYNGTGTFEARR